MATTNTYYWIFLNLLICCIYGDYVNIDDVSIRAARIYRDAYLNGLDNSDSLPIQELQKHFNSSSIDRYSTDNRKPAFRGCKDYAPKLKEEQPSNTFVIKVEAEDPDEHDSITYSFEKSVTERAKFRINSKTGEIVTSYTFDRDEPIREKEVDLLSISIK